MDLFPLWNSVRISALSAGLVCLVGSFLAYRISRLPKRFRLPADVLFTLPLVLPPTVVGYLLLLLLGKNRPVGAALESVFGVPMTMRWWSAVFAVAVVSFPIFYRAARSAFESFPETLADAGRTLGPSEKYIFFRIRLPFCRRMLTAGAVLAFARGLGEFGATQMLAGYTPGRTATLASEVYQLWSIGDDAGALRWAAVELALSAAVLLAVGLTERKEA